MSEPNADSRVRMVEITEDSIVVTFVREPRISSGGSPILRSETVVVALDDEATAALITDTRLVLDDLGRDLLRETSRSATISLDDYEEQAERDADELENDLGMGDN